MLNHKINHFNIVMIKEKLIVKFLIKPLR